MKKRTILVTGGAGYLGLCTAHWLSKNGYAPILLDDFSSSRRPTRCPFPLHEVDLKDSDATDRAFREAGPADGIIHFAAHTLVPESMTEPARYLRNNVLAAIHAADAAVRHGIPALVHSSSCAVYGVPAKLPISEDTPFAPLSPYGESKVLAERALDQFARLGKLRVVHLRYFNPAGALPGLHGEAHEPETHLIPNVVRNALEGKPITIFGTGYPTPDGTCVRDFIHVVDLAEAHRLALERLGEDAESTRAVNIGTGRGASVLEVVAAAERALGTAAKRDVRPARPGDPPMLVSDTRRMAAWLRWTPERSLEEMIASHATWLREGTR
jgi:UDP-glucose-4-epimerase GalE